MALSDSKFLGEIGLRVTASGVHTPQSPYIGIRDRAIRMRIAAQRPMAKSFNGVPNVVPKRHVLKVARPIVCFFAVLMVYGHSARLLANECFGNDAMYPNAPSDASIVKVRVQIPCPVKGRIKDSGTLAHYARLSAKPSQIGHRINSLVPNDRFPDFVRMTFRHGSFSYNGSCLGSHGVTSPVLTRPLYHAA